MIYECIQCQAPQAPGDVACPHCGAQFAGPVPANATLEDEMLEETTPQDAAPKETSSAELRPPPVFPTPAPVETTTAYTRYPEPTGSGRPSLPPLLLIGGGLGILAIIGVVYLILSVGQSAVNSSTGPVPTQTMPMIRIQPVSTAPMMTPSAGTAPAGSDSAQAAPIGRWMTKTFDYYEFAKDGTGSRGNASGGKHATTFSWVVVKNQLILSTAKSTGTEKVPFSYGPGGDSLYLRQQNGQYLEFTRTGH